MLEEKRKLRGGYAVGCTVLKADCGQAQPSHFEMESWVCGGQQMGLHSHRRLDCAYRDQPSQDDVVLEVSRTVR